MFVVCTISLSLSGFLDEPVPEDGISGKEYYLRINWTTPSIKISKATERSRYQVTPKYEYIFTEERLRRIHREVEILFARRGDIQGGSFKPQRSSGKAKTPWKRPFNIVEEKEQH